MEKSFIVLFGALALLSYSLQKEYGIGVLHTSDDCNDGHIKFDTLVQTLKIAIQRTEEDSFDSTKIKTTTKTACTVQEATEALVHLREEEKVDVVIGHPIAEAAKKKDIRRLGLLSKKHGIHICNTIGSFNSKKQLIAKMHEMKDCTRVVILLGNRQDSLMSLLCDFGMCGPKYAFLIVANPSPYWTYRNSTNNYVKHSERIPEHLFYVIPSSWSTQADNDKMTVYPKQFSTHNNDFLLRDRMYFTKESSNHIATGYDNIYLYDTVYVYGLWLKHVLQTGSDERTGTALMDFVKNLTFNGVIEAVKFNQKGHRFGKYWILNYGKDVAMPKISAVVDTSLQIGKIYSFGDMSRELAGQNIDVSGSLKVLDDPGNTETGVTFLRTINDLQTKRHCPLLLKTTSMYRMAASFQHNQLSPMVDADTSPENDAAAVKLQVLSEPEWKTSDGNPPVARPSSSLISAVATPVVVIVLAAWFLAMTISFFKLKWKKIKKRSLKKEGSENRVSVQEMSKRLWKIDSADIQSKNNTSSKENIVRQHRTVDVSTNEEINNQDNDGWEFKGNIVSLKHFGRNKQLPSAVQMSEFIQMRDMKHQNINPFVGACVEEGRTCVVYMHCSKGKLRDILENKEIVLDWGFKSFIISDLIRGLCYLHESVLQNHGRLSSNCCVVDGRWVLKISDYGHWRAGEYNQDDIDVPNSVYEDLLWTAPELLREKMIAETGTKAGDIYSLAIIVNEVAYRMGPFPTTHLTAKEIVTAVSQGSYIPFRPMKLFEGFDDMPIEFIKLMDSAWVDNPNLRPSIQYLKNFLFKVNKESRTNIMDTMIRKMEIYTSNLEGLVEQGTHKLVEEKKKATALLYKILPREIADKMIMGDLVVPESFENVTIFFSDIVQFTRLASSSTPVQVIHLLNDLYSLFDHTINSYDVYKVETIGDSYMVVSGAPKKNGNRHIQEIANMALDIVYRVSKFKISHLLDKKLKVRIGINTGPCCAGIVGTTMPRYCLYGDSVNTASRMESHSEAGKIHISESFARALRKLGGFQVRLRGQIEIKGKGNMVTYWLDGKEEFEENT